MAFDATEREQLDIKIRLTVNYEFGSACDFVDPYIAQGKISREAGEAIKKEIRSRGNNILRVTSGHLDCVNISRNHRAEHINKDRVIRQLDGEKG